MNCTMMNHLKIAVAGIGMMTLTACNGIFDDIYTTSRNRLCQRKDSL